MPRVTVGRLDALPRDRPLLVVVAGRRVALTRAGDTVHALDDSCPHAGGPLSEGTVGDGALTCPYHGWVWDLATGGCRAPGRGARAVVYRAGVDDGEVWVELP